MLNITWRVVACVALISSVTSTKLSPEESDALPATAGQYMVQQLVNSIIEVQPKTIGPQVKEMLTDEGKDPLKKKEELISLLESLRKEMDDRRKELESKTGEKSKRTLNGDEGQEEGIDDELRSIKALRRKAAIAQRFVSDLDPETLVNFIALFKPGLEQALATVAYE